MNRPAPVKSDNFFILLLQALRRRRVPIALRIVSHSLILVSVVMLAFTWLFNLQMSEVMQQQSDAVGRSLERQTVASASELLAVNDLLSLKVMLDRLAENPLVAHVVIHGGDKRVIAEAGQRPQQALFDAEEGVFSAPITLQEVNAGQLSLTLDMQQFRQPLAVGLQNFGLSAIIVLLVTLFLGMQLGSKLSLPLLQLRLWLRDPDHQAPGNDRQDELGDLARQLQQRLAPPRPPAAEATETEEDDSLLEDLDNLLKEPAAPGSPRSTARQVRRPMPPASEPELDAEALGLEPDDLQAAPAAGLPPVYSTVLAARLGAHEELQRRLPQARLTELLQRYRDGLQQASRLYQGQLLRLPDGSSLILFHSNQTGEDYLTRALCCGELLRALGHALQMEVADSGLPLQLQLALSRGEGLYGLPVDALQQQDASQSVLSLSRYSRNLLLLDQTLSGDASLRTRARLRTLASPAGASCIERLQEPLSARLELQLGQMLQHA